MLDVAVFPVHNAQALATARRIHDAVSYGLRDQADFVGLCFMDVGGGCVQVCLVPRGATLASFSGLDFEVAVDRAVFGLKQRMAPGALDGIYADRAKTESDVTARLVALWPRDLAAAIAGSKAFLKELDEHGAD